MASLYNLSTQYKLLQQFIEEGDHEGFELALSQIEGDIAEKLEGYASVIKNIESDVNGLDGEIKRLTERKKSMEKNIDQMKERMAEALITVDGNKVKTEKFTFSLRKSQKVQVLDENMIPREFINIKPTVNISAIREKLKNGEQIDGAQLIENKSLQIK